MKKLSIKKPKISIKIKLKPAKGIKSHHGMVTLKKLSAEAFKK